MMAHQSFLVPYALGRGQADRRMASFEFLVLSFEFFCMRKCSVFNYVSHFWGL